MHVQWKTDQLFALIAAFQNDYSLGLLMGVLWCIEAGAYLHCNKLVILVDDKTPGTVFSSISIWST